jgi:hypothetical protein
MPAKITGTESGNSTFIRIWDELIPIPFAASVMDSSICVMEVYVFWIIGNKA